MKRLSLLFILAFLAPWLCSAEDSLPIAPRRSDDRDQLPTQAFVSLSGNDPVMPGDTSQAASKTAVAQKSAPKGNSKPAHKLAAPKADHSRSPASAKSKKTAAAKSKASKSKSSKNQSSKASKAGKAASAKKSSKKLPQKHKK